MVSKNGGGGYSSCAHKQQSGTRMKLANSHIFVFPYVRIRSLTIEHNASQWMVGRGKGCTEELRNATGVGVGFR